jgi:hypothetical protein
MLLSTYFSLNVALVAIPCLALISLAGICNVQNVHREAAVKEIYIEIRKIFYFLLICHLSPSLKCNLTIQIYSSVNLAFWLTAMLNLYTLSRIITSENRLSSSRLRISTGSKLATSLYLKYLNLENNVLTLVGYLHDILLYVFPSCTTKASDFNLETEIICASLRVRSRIFFGKMPLEQQFHVIINSSQLVTK